MPGREVVDWWSGSTRILDDPTGNIGTMLDRMAAVLDQLEAATADAATWNGLTPAQRQQATLVAIRVTCRTTRLILGQFGSAV